jgi:tRNA(fMet)-specific endonuclease VapC
MPWRSSGLLEMNGRRLLLDTNAIICLLKGENKSLVRFVEQADWVGISIISKLEFLAFPDLLESDAALFEEFQERIDIIDLADIDVNLISKIIAIRKSHKLKLPDAIIIATAITNACLLITADKHLHDVVDEVETLSFENGDDLNE